MPSPTKKAATRSSPSRTEVAPTIADAPLAVRDHHAPDETFDLMLAELDGRINEIERRTDRLIARYD
jgi:hypothetical protein